MFYVACLFLAIKRLRERNIASPKIPLDQTRNAQWFCLDDAVMFYYKGTEKSLRFDETDCNTRHFCSKGPKLRVGNKFVSSNLTEICSAYLLT